MCNTLNGHWSDHFVLTWAAKILNAIKLWIKQGYQFKKNLHPAELLDHIRVYLLYRRRNFRGDLIFVGSAQARKVNPRKFEYNE